MKEIILIVTMWIVTIYTYIYYVSQIIYEYKNNYYLEPEKHFQEKIDKIKAKDGNHMILNKIQIQLSLDNGIYYVLE